MEKTFIATTPEEVKKLLEKEGLSANRVIKVPPVKTVYSKTLTAMEAITLLGSLPRIDEDMYLEEKSSNEEEDFYLLRKKFADYVSSHLKTNRITSLILGEAFAKKVRYGVTYSSDIERIISLMSEKINSM